MCGCFCVLLENLQINCGYYMTLHRSRITRAKFRSFLEFDYLIIQYVQFIQDSTLFIYFVQPCRHLYCIISDNLVLTTFFFIHPKSKFVYHNVGRKTI